MSCLHRRNRAVLSHRDLGQLLCRALSPAAHVKMIAHQQQKGLSADKFTRAIYGMTVTPRRGLFDKSQAPALASGCSFIRLLVARTHHYADLLDTCGEDFLYQDSQGRLG